MHKLKNTLAFAIAATLLGCTSRGTDVTTGECITPVDGMQIYKVTRVEGESIYAQPAGDTGASAGKPEMEVPETMHYVTIDCP